MGSEATCRFCGETRDLRDSHILPAFIYRWLRTRSGTGHIRQTDNPNRRIQDGLKCKLLCNECEGLFSRFETAFATKVFHPWNNGTYRVAYDDWLLKFCVSVSWRVLEFCYGKNQNHEYTPEQKRLVSSARQSWREFLREETPHPGEFEQHLLIFDSVEDTTISDLPSNFNRFMDGAVTLDIVGSANSLMTFAKLGRFIVLGIIQKGPNAWNGTKIGVKHGVLKPGTFTLPAGLLDLFTEKAIAAATAMEGMSATQLNKVDDHIRTNIDAFRHSEQFASILADARLFGDEAVIRKARDDEAGKT